MAGGFNLNTRRKIIALPAVTKPTGGGLTTFSLPRTGLLAGLYLVINAGISGTLSNQNALGKSSIIRRVSVTLNSGIDLYSVSGPGYAYLCRDMIETGQFDPIAGYEGTAAVAADTGINLNMYVPFAVNSRDPLGLIMLQNEQTLVTVEIDWAADSSVATGATVTGTCTPYMVLYTVPRDPADWPPLNVVMQTLEETQTVSGSGEVIYKVPRGNAYTRIGLGLGMGASGSDSFSRVAVRLNQSDYLFDLTTSALDVEYSLYHGGRARPAGTALLDFMATSGFGSYGQARDIVNSAAVTDFDVVVNATGAGTLYVVRQQLVTLA